MKAVSIMVASISVSNTEIIELSPSLPHPGSCLSYWQSTTRAYPHLNANRNTPVPASKKYVIIGSGISGALTAFELTEHGIKGEDIVVLEAREAASGASSRNAGHIRPDAFRGFQHYSKVHGGEQALKIISNEKLVLERFNDFVKEHTVPCDFHHTATFDVCMTPTFAKYEAANFTAYKEAGGDVSHVSLSLTLLSTQSDRYEVSEYQDLGNALA